MTAPDCTAFQLRLLAVVANRDRPPKGVTVKETLEAYYGEQLNHGRLYQNLDALVDDGLIDKTPRDGRTNAYRLTQAGKDTLESELAWLKGQLTGEVALP